MKMNTNKATDKPARVLEAKGNADAMRNAQTELSSAIAAAIDNADTTVNREAMLVHSMFMLPAEFSAAAIVALMRNTPAERSEKLSKIAAEHSPRFAKERDAVKLVKALKERKVKPTPEQVMAAEVAALRVKAALAMIGRAIVSVYGLRSMKTEGLSLTNKGARTTLRAAFVGEAITRANGETVEGWTWKNFSGRELAKLGADALGKIVNKGKAAKARQPIQPPETVMSNGFKSLASTLSSTAVSKIKGGIDDLLSDDAAVKNAHALFDALFLREFCDDDKIDEATLADYISKRFNVDARISIRARTMTTPTPTEAKATEAEVKAA